MGGLRGLLDTGVTTPEESQYLNTQVAPSSEFGRGMAANQVQSEAGDLYSQSLDAELRGDQQGATSLRQKAAGTMSYMPKMQTREEGFGGYAAGVAGQLAPDLPGFAASALAGRALGSVAGGLTGIRNLGKVGAFAGAYAPGSALARRAAITEQEQDPGLMQASPQDRAAAAGRQSVVGGLLGAVPISHALGSAVSGGLRRGLFNGLATTAAENALASAGMTFQGQREAQGLDPNRDSSQDVNALKEAAISGGVGGAFMHGAFAVPGLPLRIAGAVARGAVGLGRAGDDVVAPSANAAAGAVKARGTTRDIGVALNDRFGEDVRAGVSNATDAVKSAAGAMSDQYDLLPDKIRNMGKTPEAPPPTPADQMNSAFPPTAEDQAGPAPGVSAADKPTDLKGSVVDVFNQLKAKAAPVIDTVSGAAKDYMQRAQALVGGDVSTEEGRQAILGKMSDSASTAGKKVSDFVGSFMNKEESADDTTKSSYYTSDGKPRTDLDGLVWSHLSDSAKRDPKVLDALPDLTKTLADSVENGTASSLSGYKSVSSVFTDPVAFEREFGNAIKGDTKGLAAARSTTSAEDDASKPNSFIYNALSDGAKDTLKSGQLKQVGALIDQMPHMGRNAFDQAQQKLMNVFPSKARAQQVLDYYKNEFVGKTKAEPLFDNRMDEDKPDTSSPGDNASEDSAGNPNIPPPHEDNQSDFIFKNHESGRPFFAGEDTGSATKKAEAEGYHVSAVNHADFADQFGLDHDHEATRLISDAANRLDAIVAKGKTATGDELGVQRQRYARLKPQVDLMNKVMDAKGRTNVPGHGMVEAGAKGVLQLHTVLESQKFGPESRTHMSSSEMANARASRADKADIAHTLINIRSHSPTEAGKTITNSISLEHAARQELKLNSQDYQHVQTRPAKMQAAAKGALAKIAARPNFVGFEKSGNKNAKELHQLVVDRGSGAKIDLTDTAKPSKGEWTDAQQHELETGKAKVQDVVGKYKGADPVLRREIQLKLETRTAQLKAEGVGDSPAAKYARFRATHIDAALDKMTNVRRNEASAEAQKKLAGELKLNNRPDVRSTQEDIHDLSEARAESRKKMASLAGLKNTNYSQKVEYNYHKARHAAADNMLHEKQSELKSAKFEAKKADEGGEGEVMASNARAQEGATPRHFNNDMEIIGRSEEHGPFVPKTGAEKLGRAGTGRDRPAYQGSEAGSERPSAQRPTSELGQPLPETSRKNASPAEMKAYQDAQAKRVPQETPNVQASLGQVDNTQVQKAQEKLSRDIKKWVDVSAALRAKGEKTLSLDAYLEKSRPDKTENPSLAKDGASSERDEKNSNYTDKGGGPPEALDPEVAKGIREEAARSLGPDVAVHFNNMLGDKAGTYTPSTEDTHAFIKVAIGSTAQMQNAAWHESAHHLFDTLGKMAGSPAARAMYRDIKQVVLAPSVQSQLRALLRDHPRALDQLHDPNEAMAYAYQFWRQGEADGESWLNLNPRGTEWFVKIRDFVYNVLGVMSKSQKTESLFAAFHDGLFADSETVDAAINDLHANTIRDRMDHLAPGIGKAFDALLLGATDRLRQYGLNSLDHIATLMHKDTDREWGGLGFLQRKSQVGGMLLNSFQDGLGNANHVDMAKALKNLQAMRDPSSPLEHHMRDLLNQVFDYMVRAGVRTKNEDGEWVPLDKKSFHKNYFPRVWDRERIDRDRIGLRALLMKEGKMTRTASDKLIDSMVSGDGLLDTAETSSHLGFVPANSALKKRIFDFITPKNAEQFAKYQSQDLYPIVQKYIYQAAHRAEHTRSFGYDGSVLTDAMAEAKKQGLREEDLKAAGKTIQALEGTLGHDFNPQTRKLFMGITAYENLALLPFATLSSLSDAAGISLRSNDFKDQFRAMELGIKGIATELVRGKEGNPGLLARARQFGIIDSLNMLENYGPLYNSSFMSSTLRKVNDKFFHWNGMETWNQQMRLAGFEAGQNFVLRAVKGLGSNNAKTMAQSDRYLRELGLKNSDAQHIKPGTGGDMIDFDSLPPETSARMQAAMYRFVDGAVLRPNAAHMPVWASDPAWMLIAHLKRFSFGFQNTFIKRYSNELGNGNMKAAPLFLSFLPYGIFSGAVRRSIAGVGAFTGMSAGSILTDGSARSGMEGVGMFLNDAIEDVHRGKLPGTSFLGPTAEHLQKALEFVTGGPESAKSLLLRSTPLSPLVKDFTPTAD